MSLKEINCKLANTICVYLLVEKWSRVMEHWERSYTQSILWRHINIEGKKNLKIEVTLNLYYKVHNY